VEDKGKNKQDQQIHNKEDFYLKAGEFIVEKNEKFRDNYTIGQSLGQGAFGEVRKC